jgi:DUF971 family protein
MNTYPTPREIKRIEGTGLQITWSDSSITNISNETLRRLCPCAGCREKRGDDTHAKPLTGRKRSLTVVQNTLEEEISLKSIWGVGNYAIGIRWGDGHDSGIYTYQYLRELGTGSQAIG